MTNTRNNLGFEAKVEYSKASFLDQLPSGLDGLDTIGAINPFNDPPIFLTPRDGLLLTPLALQTPEDFTDTLKTSDLIFCEKPDYFLNSEDCPTCVRNPISFVPDWRRLSENEDFFNGKECKYSVVIDTGVKGLPTDEAEIRELKIKGINSLLNIYGKSEITTTVYYVLAGQEEPETADPSQITPDMLSGVEREGGKFVFQVQDFENVGSNIDSLLNGVLVSTAVPAPRKGYTRLLLETDTALGLLDTRTRQGLQAVTIEYDVPEIPELPGDKAPTTKALVSIDAEAFLRVPEQIVAESEVSQQLQSEGNIETTINGQRLFPDFAEVVRALKRADKYATNAIKGTQQGRFYYTNIGTGLPVVIDFVEESRKLENFRKNYLIPALQKGLGVGIEDVEKVRFTFEVDQETSTIKIVEVVANVYGCEDLNFSSLNGKIFEVTDLFNYTQQRVLGYVAALPDMVYYIRGAREVVWIEFITRFTFPSVEFRTPVDLITFEDDRSLAQCAAEKSAIQLVNELLDNVLGTPDLLLDGTVESICRAAADVVAERQTQNQIFAQQQENNLEELRSNIKASKEEITKELSDLSVDSPASRFRRKILQDKITSLDAQLTEAEEQSTKQFARETREYNKFAKDLERKLKNASLTLSSKPLAKLLINAILFDLQESLEQDDRAVNLREIPKTKTFELNDVQKSVDMLMGGWCGITRIALEGIQCLLGGLGPEDLKRIAIQKAFDSLKPHSMRNFLRELAIRDPERIEQLNQVLTATTGRAVAEALDVLSDPTENSVFNYGAEYDLEYDKLTSGLPTVSDEEEKELRKQARKNVNTRRVAQLRGSRFVLDVTQPTDFASDALVSVLPSNLQDLAGTFINDNIETYGDLVRIIGATLEEIFGIDELFNILSERVPGFNILGSFVGELECVVAKLPDLNPPLGLDLKSLNLDLCSLSVDGKIDFTLPRFNPPNGEEKFRIKTATKNFFAFLGEYLHDMFLDLATQLLVKSLVTLIESTLDLACDLLNVAGRSIADEITGGNTKFREELREALCPTGDLSDEQFANAINNVFGALSNNTSGQSCVQNLTTAEMGNFIDSVLVTIDYNELYRLMLGSANPETIAVVQAIAKTTGSQCIADIFGDQDNVYDYFKGLGLLINAREVFNDFPEDVVVLDGVNACPPNIRDNIESTRYMLLKNQGLDDQQIRDQLDYAKQKAQEKLADLVGILTNGPYADLPSLVSSGQCPPTGLIRRDPTIAASMQLLTDANMEPVEQAMIRDLIGVRGLLPRILSDSEGKGLRTHRFLTRGIFGNPIGRNNSFIQFYSDDSLVDSETNIFQLITGQQPRLDQEGEKYPKVGSIIQPIGGFGPTVGGYLYNKLLNYKVGFYSDNESEQEIITFKTRLRDPNIESRNEELGLRNADRVKQRIFYIARWAAVTHFVDYNTLEPFLNGSILGTDYIVEFDQKTKDILNDEPYQLKTPSIEKRRGIFSDLIEACESKIFLLPGNKTSLAQERVQRLLSGGIDKKNLNINAKIVGISLADFRDRVKTNRFDNIPPEGKTYWNINLAKKLTLTQELRDLYLNIAETVIEVPLETPEFNNPYELGLDFVPYPLKNSEGKDRRADFKARVTYDMNPQDENGEFFADKYKYRFIYSNTYNPFGSDYQSPESNIQAALNADNTGPTGSNGFPENGSLTSADFGSILPAPSNAEDIVFLGDITSVPSDDVRQYVDSYIADVTSSDVVYSYETEFLRTWLNANVVSTDIEFDSNTAPEEDPVVEFFDFVNQGFFRRISRKIAASSDGLPTEGFKFGYDVFKQPKAIVLDPAKYGGTEFNPPFYVEPPSYDGWLGLMQKLIPQEEGCDPRITPLYEMRDISQETRAMFTQLRRDERLDFSPICTKEAPYNFIRDNATIVSIEGMIRATTRLHIIDFIMKSVPVFSQFAANFEGNFDNLLESYLADYVLDRVRETGVTRPTRRIVVDDTTNAVFVSGETVPVNKYYLNFLESAVTNVLIKIDSGILPEDSLSEDQRTAVAKIRQIIQDYYNKFEGTEGTLSEESIQTQGILQSSINPEYIQRTNTSRNLAKFNKVRARRIKVGLLYETVKETEQLAETIFSTYIKLEFETLRERLNAALTPEVDDLGLVFLSDSLFMNGHIRKRAIDRGAAFPEAEEDPDAPTLYATRPDGTIEYELPYDVPYYNSNGELTSNVVSRSKQLAENLEEAESLIERIFQGNLKIDLNPQESSSTYSLSDKDFEWPFILEKYIRIQDKSPESLGNSQTLEAASGTRSGTFLEVNSRPDNLRGVQRLEDWVNYLSTLDDFAKEKKISDIWDSWYFGLRLSIILDPRDPLGKKLKELGIDVEGTAQLVTLEEGVEKIIIPISVGELQVPDQIIGETTTFTDVLGEVKDFELIRQYDTLCLVNEMVKTTEFNSFFKYVFPLRRYLSILTVYISNAFYLSIGNTGPALPEISSNVAGALGPGDAWAVPGGRALSGFRLWDKNDGNFKRSKRILKAMFMDLYNTINKTIDGRSRSRSNKRFESSVKELLADLIPEDLLSGMPWWQRRMRVDKPFDLFDGECQDEEDYF